MERITSGSNEKIKFAVKLSENSRVRRDSDMFLLEGARLCEDAALCGIDILQAFVSVHAVAAYASRIDVILSAADECYEISDDIAYKLSGTSTPQGIFCVCRQLGVKARIQEDGKYIALENVQDPSNLGAISRTAEALGITGLIISGGCDIYNPKAQRAGMGSLLRLPIISVDSLAELILQLKESGMLTLATVPDSDATPVTELDFSRGTVCVIGNEGNGMSAEAINACEVRTTILMKGRVQSFNAATAASIMMWEMTR